MTFSLELSFQFKTSFCLAFPLNRAPDGKFVFGLSGRRTEARRHGDGLEPQSDWNQVLRSLYGSSVLRKQTATVESDGHSLKAFRDKSPPLDSFLNNSALQPTNARDCAVAGCEYD